MGSCDHLVTVYAHVAGDYVCGVCVNYASPFRITCKSEFIPALSIAFSY